jgi:hypothetical protein
MDHRLKPIEVDGAERINGKSQYTLPFFVLPGVRISPYRDAEDPVWLISIIGHDSLRVGAVDPRAYSSMTVSASAADQATARATAAANDVGPDFLCSGQPQLNILNLSVARAVDSGQARLQSLAAAPQSGRDTGDQVTRARRPLRWQAAGPPPVRHLPVAHSTPLRFPGTGTMDRSEQNI